MAYSTTNHQENSRERDFFTYIGYRVYLPTPEDLEDPESPYRIKKYYEKNGNWFLTNHCDQEYSRWGRYSPSWYFRTGQLHYFSLDKRANIILEKVYGRYIGIPCDDDSVDSRKEQNLSYKPAQLKNGQMVSSNASEDFQKPSSSQPIKRSNINPNIVSASSEQSGLHESVHRNNNPDDDHPQKQLKDNKNSFLSSTTFAIDPASRLAFNSKMGVTGIDSKFATSRRSDALADVHRKVSDKHDQKNPQENKPDRENSLQPKRTFPNSPELRSRARNMIKNAIKNKRENQSVRGDYEPPDDLTGNLASNQNEAKKYQSSSNEFIPDNPNLPSGSRTSSSQATPKAVITVSYRKISSPPSEPRLKQSRETKEQAMVDNPAKPVDTFRRQADNQTPSLTCQAFQQERIPHDSQTEDTTRRLRSSSVTAGTQHPSLLHRPGPLDPGSNGNRMCFESETKDSSSLVKSTKPSGVKITENAVRSCNKSDNELSSLDEQVRQFPQKTTEDSIGHNLKNKNDNVKNNPSQTKSEQNSESSTGMTCAAPVDPSKTLENNAQLYFNTHSKATYSAGTKPNEHTVVRESISDENLSSDVNNRVPLVGNDSAVRTRREHVVTRSIESLKNIREKPAVSLDVTGDEDDHETRNYSSSEPTKHTVSSFPGESNVASATTSIKSDPTTILDALKERKQNAAILRYEQEGAKLCHSDSTPLNYPHVQNQFTVEGDIAQHNNGSLLPSEKTSGQSFLNETVKPTTFSPETSCSSRPLLAGKHISADIFPNQVEQEQQSNGNGIGITGPAAAATSVIDDQTFSNVSILPLSPGDCSEAKVPRKNDILPDSPAPENDNRVKEENASGSVRTFADVTKNGLTITNSRGSPPNERNSQPDSQQSNSKSDRIKKENMKKQKKELWEKIVRRFKARCNSEGDCLKDVPLEFEPDRTSVQKFFNLETVTFDAQKQKIKKTCGFHLRQTDSTNLILVRGPFCFGKTTLLSLLAYQWACNKLFSTCALSSFKLCVFLHLETLDLEKTNLSEVVQKELSQNEYSDVGLLQEVLTEHADEIVFLFDGYDELSKSARKVVKRFFNTPDMFEKSKFIVSASPEASEEIGYLFHRVIDIISISSQQKSKVMKRLKPAKRTFSQIVVAALKDSSNFLSELPPYFIYFINERIDTPFATDTFTDLYSLFDSSLQYIIRFQVFSRQLLKPNTKRSYHCENVFNRLGKLMFSALLQGRRVFSESLLRSQFAISDLHNLLKWNILYEVSESQTLTTTCKFLMVFFAAKYLKHEWGNQTTKVERTEFLAKVFCGNACSGDYVMGKYDQRCLFYVGLIPEIVLKLDRGSLENATIEMYYDVRDVEFSNAFDTVNLLVRVNERFLPRFAFKTRDIEDPQLNSGFENVLGHLTINNCYVDYCFYENVFERTTFLEAVARDTDDGNIVLHTVFRNNVNEVTNSVLIDFTLSRRNDVWDFTFTMLSHYLEGFALKEASTSSGADFLFEFVLAVLESEPKQKVVVSCVDSFAEGTLDYQNNIKFIIFYNPQTKQMSVKYSVPISVSGSIVYDSECKAKHWLQADVQRTKNNISKSLLYMINPKVTVQILRSSD